MGATVAPLQKVKPKDIEANLGLVHVITQACAHYAHGLVDYDDLLGWGTLGLIHALERFDHSKGFRFSSYAAWCIKGKILVGIRSTYSEMWKAKERGEDTTPYLMDRENLPEQGGDPRKVLERNIQARQILDVVWPLFTEKQKEVLYLYFFQDMTQVEIAKHLGTQRQNVKQLIETAKRRARVALAKEAA